MSRLAAQTGWAGEVIPTQKFALQAFYPRALRQTDTLTVYIEGDGLAWASSSTPSFDPTPVDALALKLALRDPGPAVYLGRPCQYTGVEGRPECERKYWTSHRFAPEVIEATDHAVDQLKTRFKVKNLVLIGYSGGGAVAALVAARRQDVIKLVTVAGNLDHRAWTTALRLTPLSGSLNPADVADRLTGIPQIHYVGGKDKVIAEFVARSYASQFINGQQPDIVVIPEFDHRCCWAEDWPIRINH